MLILAAGHSHLYPGARGRVLSGAAAEGPLDGPVVVEFGDGSCVPGALSGDCLCLAAYRTAAGTGIAAKTWRIAFAGPAFRVLARAGDGRPAAA